MPTLEQHIVALQERNKKLELDKAWGTSWFRKIFIAALTYMVVVIFFLLARFPKPFLNAIIPTLGFILSNLSLTLMKNI